MNQSNLMVNPLPESARGPSPIPDKSNQLQIPSARPYPARTEEAKFTWGEEEKELIKTFGVLASSLGLSKSLSTSDISMIEGPKNSRQWVSEENLNAQIDRFEGIFPHKLEAISRSCSTWVAVGDVNSTSQLPSPHTKIGASDSPAITAVDFVLSVNKKIRQSYIKRRLQISYKLLKSLSETDDSTDAAPPKKSNVPVGTTLLAVNFSVPSKDVLDILRQEGSLPPPNSVSGQVSNLTAKDVERDRGRQLTRYERNIIIFNWLQTLDGAEFEPLA